MSDTAAPGRPPTPTAVTSTAGSTARAGNVGIQDTGGAEVVGITDTALQQDDRGLG